MGTPYIGVTGFTSTDEIKSAIESFPKCPRKLMIGVLASWKSLRGVPLKSKWARRTPDYTAFASLFMSPDALNLVHFSTPKEHEAGFVADMLFVHEIAGGYLDGFQLNMAWPAPQELERYRVTQVGEKSRVVLQLGANAVAQAGDTPKGLVKKLGDYVRLVDDILLDPSGGAGQAFDTERAREFLHAIANKGWPLGLGVAGGLGPDSLGLVEPLVDEFPLLSIDAEGRLRNEDDSLDAGLVSVYLEKAGRLFPDTRSLSF